jgi:predicted XRE-type DNA-binding protein
MTSAFNDIFAADEAEVLLIQAELLRGLQSWLIGSGLTQLAAAKQLNVSQARVSDIKRGKISAFSLDFLIRLSVKAGLHPRIQLAA